VIPDFVLRALQTRGIFAINCEIYPSFIDCEVFCLEENNTQKRAINLVYTDNQEQFVSVILPQLSKGEHRNIRLKRIIYEQATV